MAKFKGTDLLGWCMTAQHSLCKRVVHLSMQNVDKMCGCKCHREEG